MDKGLDIKGKRLAVSAASRGRGRGITASSGRGRSITPSRGRASSILATRGGGRVITAFPRNFLASPLPLALEL